MMLCACVCACVLGGGRFSQGILVEIINTELSRGRTHTQTHTTHTQLHTYLVYAAAARGCRSSIKDYSGHIRDAQWVFLWLLLMTCTHGLVRVSQFCIFVKVHNAYFMHAWGYKKANIWSSNMDDLILHSSDLANSYISFVITIKIIQMVHTTNTATTTKNYNYHYS